MTNYILDENRNPVQVADTIEWAKWFEKNYNNRRVMYHELIGFRVSTVFLGIDHGFGGKPQLFETMVFKGNSHREVYMERSSTWAEAEKEHCLALRWVGCIAPHKMKEIDEELKGEENDDQKLV